MSKDKMTDKYVNALCEIVANLFQIKEDIIIIENCEIAENALYKGGVMKWAKDNKYIPFGDGRERWDHGFKSVDKEGLKFDFINAMKAKAALEKSKLK